MLLGVTTLGLVMGTWVMAVTTERGQQLTAWVAYFLGLLVLIVIMLGSILISLGFVIRSVGA